MLSRRLSILILFICASIIIGNSYAKDVDEGWVSYVIDGDTIVLEGGQRIRYIGIDTPERGRPYYIEAKRENERLVQGKKVRLEYDVEKQDRYGRTLAYIYVDDVFVNAELVKNGYAMIYTLPPNVKYAKTFLALQQEARMANRGLWGLNSKSGRVKGSRSIWGCLIEKLRRIFK